MANKPRTIFLTGVTGALGKEMIRELLTKTDDHLYLLVRRRQRLSHWDRVRKMLKGYGCEGLLGTRVHVFEGDVTLPRLGLQEEDVELLRKKITTFFHVAALTALNGSKDDCYNINFEGTQNALDLAWDLRNKGKLERFFYFSTAYAAGSLQDYVSMEDGLPEEPAHANHYESSKYNAEKDVRRAMMEGLPVTIFRPSIVVGNSKTGEVTEFNVIYPFMKLYSSGIIKILPANPENSFNVVPIDYVVNAALAISQQENSVGKAFHLVSEEPPKIGMIMDLREKEFPDFAEFQLVEPELFKRDQLDATQQGVYDILEPYLGYLNSDLSFDARNTREALKGTDVTIPKTGYDFMKVLTQYAVDAGYLVGTNG